jgi:hypothetical protein
VAGVGRAHASVLLGSAQPQGRLDDARPEVPRPVAAIDSHIEGFETLARLAADAAAARGLDLDPTTRSNFAAMEVVLPPPAGAWEQAR